MFKLEFVLELVLEFERQKIHKNLSGTRSRNLQFVIECATTAHKNNNNHRHYHNSNSPNFIIHCCFIYKLND